MSDFIHQAFGLYQLNESWAFIIWCFQHTFGLIPIGALIHKINSLDHWSLAIYIPVGLLLFSPAYYFLEFLVKRYHLILILIFTNCRPNKVYSKRLPLLVTPKIKYISQYRGDTHVMTWNLFFFSILLMLGIHWIPIPFGKTMLYLVLLSLLFVYVSQILHFGYMRIGLILSGLLFAHCMLYFNIHFSFIILPHEKLFNFIPMNPSDYAIDISRLYFSWILFFSYFALVRYVGNFIRWKFLQDKSTVTNLYDRNVGYYAFGLLRITELTDKELKLWNTQRERFERIFLLWPMIVILFFVGLLHFFLHTMLYLPCKLMGLKRYADAVNVFAEKILAFFQFKPNRFLAEWRLDPSLDGVTRTGDEINITLNNYLVMIRMSLGVNEVELFNRLVKAFPNFESMQKIDSPDPKKQREKLKAEKIVQYDKDKLPSVLEDLGCSDESIQVILKKYTAMKISKAIQQAKLEKNKTATLFQYLEHG